MLRRQFVYRMITFLTGVIGLGFSAKKFALGEAEKIEIAINDYPELTKVGGSKLIKDIEIGSQTDNIIIVRKKEDEFVVFSAICRHKKCNVKYKNEKSLFVCPCHGSTYDMEGKVQKGPSTTDIPKYKFERKGDKLIIYAQ